MALADTARLIASLELQDKFTGPARNAERSIGSLDKKMGTLGRSGATAARGLGTLAGNLAKIGAVTIGVGIGVGIVAIKSAITAASDLNEEIDKSAVVFGKAAPEVQAFADSAASIGLSSAEALGAAGNFGNMFKTIGFANDEAADMSVSMVELAADMASFNNEDPTDMLDRLRSGLSGEAEPLRRFGVLISEATVNEFAWRTGIAKTNAKLTEAQKVQARYGLIIEQTALQQGNFADTSDSLANQQRQLRANLNNTAATMGQTLLPAAQKLAKAVNELFIDKAPQIKEFGEEIGEALSSVFTDANIKTGMEGVGRFIDKIASFEGGNFTAALDELRGAGADKGGTLSTIASSIGGIAEQVKGLPWQSIGDAARLLGTGSKALLDAFLGLPPWVQTAVLTGWGLNKLTGGALGSIVTELGKGLIKGVLGMTAGVVHIKAGTVTGVGGGVAPTGGGKVPPVVTGAAKLLPVIGALELGANLAGGTGPIEAFLTPDKDNRVVDKDAGERLDRVDASIADVDARLAEAQTSNVTNRQAVVAALNAEKAELLRTRSAIVERQRDTTRAMRDNISTARRGFADNGAKIVRFNQGIDGVRDSVRAGNSHLVAIKNKRTSITVSTQVNVTSILSAAQVVSQATAYSRTTSGGATPI